MIWKQPYFRKFTYLFGAWLVICFLSVLEVLLFEVFRANQIHIAKVLPLIRLLSGTIAILLVLLPAYALFSRSKRWVQVAGFTFSGFLFTLTYVLTFVIIYHYCFLEMRVNNLLIAVGEVLLGSLHQIVAYYFFLLGVLLIDDYLKEKTAAILKNEKIERAFSQAKFANLKSQLQPHFLFNAINGAIAIMDEKVEAAQSMLVDLSSLLRASLDIDFQKKISLEEEVALLRLYLNIEKKRFEHQLDITFNIQENTDQQLILPFTLQPLAENAIKHGFSTGIKLLQIQVGSYLENGNWIIEVRNNGSKLSDASEGVGLQNLMARLEYEYKNDFEFFLRQETDTVVNRIKFRV